MKTVEIPQLRLVRGYADMGYDCAFTLRGSGARVPVVAQRQPLGLPLQLTIEIVQFQPIDKVVKVPGFADRAGSSGASAVAAR